MSDDITYILDNMDFVQFSERFKRGTISGEDGSDITREPAEDIWQRADFVRQHMLDKPIFFAGGIGCVDDAFNYTVNISPERSFLFGSSERDVAYLGTRLCLFAAADHMSQYYLNLLNATEEEAKDIWDVERPDILVENVEAFDVPVGRSAVQGAQFMQALGYKNVAPYFADILFAPEFKKPEALRGVKRLVELAEDEHFGRSWLFPANYDKLKQMALQGSIRGFAAEFPDGIAESLEELAGIYDIEQLVLDVSRYDDGTDDRKDQLGALYQRLSTDIGKIFFL